MSPQLEAVERAIVDVEAHGLAHAAAASLEMVLENSRAGVKQQIIRRLVDPDLVGGQLERTPVSATAAEKLVGTDPEYLAHLEELRKATLAKNEAYTRLISARLRSLLGLIQMATAGPANQVMGLLSTEIDMDLVRAQDDDRSALVGGVPK